MSFGYDLKSVAAALILGAGLLAAAALPAVAQEAAADDSGSAAQQTLADGVEASPVAAEPEEAPGSGKTSAQETLADTGEAPASTPAAEGSGDWGGIWQVYDLLGQPYFIVVEDGGTALKNINPDATGDWTSGEDRLQIAWSDGWKTTLLAKDDGHEMHSFEPGADAGGEPTSVTKASQVDAIETVPAMSIDPVGKWNLQERDGDPFEVTLNADRTASSFFPHDETRNQTGTWNAAGDTAYIYWANGWTDLLVRSEHGFKKISFKPGTNVTDPPDNVAAATRAGE